MSRRVGIFQILFSGLGFAFLGTFGKMAHHRGIEASSLLSVRFLCASFILFGLCLATRKVRLNSKLILKTFLMGVLGYALFSFFYFKSIMGMNAGAAVVILFLYPIFVFAFSTFLEGRRPLPRHFLILFLCVLGMIFLVNGEISIHDPKALTYGLLSSLLYSIYVVASSRYAQNMEPYFSTCLIQFFAGIALALIGQNSISNLTSVLIGNLDLFAGLCLFSTIFPMVLFLLAAKKLSSFELSVLNVTEPFFGVVLSAALLNESLTGIQIFGAFLILTSSILVSLRGKN